MKAHVIPSAYHRLNSAALLLREAAPRVHRDILPKILIRKRETAFDSDFLLTSAVHPEPPRLQGEEQVSRFLSMGTALEPSASDVVQSTVQHKLH